MTSIKTKYQGVRLLHDGNSLKADTHQYLQGEINSSCCAELEIPLEALESELWILVADLRRSKWIRKVQSSAINQKVDLLIIGLEPEYIWFGPFHQVNIPGCFSCMSRWLHNNYRDNYHWSNFTVKEPDRKRQLTVPLTGQVISLYKSILGHFFSQPFGNHPLLNKVKRLDINRLKTSSHHFIAVHNCDLCSKLPLDTAELVRSNLTPQLKLSSAHHRIENKRLSLQKLKELFVDRHTGMIKHVYHSLSSNLMPMFAAELPIMYTDGLEIGYGRTETKQLSQMVAILETLERYGGHSPKGKKTQIRASYDQVKDIALNPQTLILHKENQLKEAGYDIVAYHENLVFNWVWGYSFKNKKAILVPEQIVYYYLLNEPELPVNRFIYDTSNGCALGGSYEEATLYGLLELVERDAYLTTWYGELTPVEIDLASVADDRVQLLLARSQTQGLSIHAFDIRVGIDIPIIWCMVVDEAKDAVVKSYCAAGAHFNPENAIYSALIEVVTSIGVYQKSMAPLRERALEMYQDNSKVQEMADHVLLYSCPESYKRLQFLFGSKGKFSVEKIYKSYNQTPSNIDLTKDLIGLIDKVLRIADDVIVVDQTYSQLGDSQLFCNKVIAPGLMPVTFGHQYRRVSLQRVNLAAKVKGIPPFESDESLNQNPHNFP